MLKQDEINEAAIKNMSVEECLEARAKLQDDLRRFHETNPGVLSRYIMQINQRLFDVNYHTMGREIGDAHEG